jgi:hypothetical protein
MTAAFNATCDSHPDLGMKSAATGGGADAIFAVVRAAKAEQTP